MWATAQWTGSNILETETSILKSFEKCYSCTFKSGIRLIHWGDNWSKKIQTGPKFPSCNLGLGATLEWVEFSPVQFSDFSFKMFISLCLCKEVYFAFLQNYIILRLMFNFEDLKIRFWNEVWVLLDFLLFCSLGRQCHHNETSLKVDFH